ncbi:MAG: hypothetical protein KDD04_10955, partial [Sinomicrobium sp.]|nr:hypothetical protein [Sinomicrobium sp.]
ACSFVWSRLSLQATRARKIIANLKCGVISTAGSDLRSVEVMSKEILLKIKTITQSQFTVNLLA